MVGSHSSPSTVALVENAGELPSLPVAVSDPVPAYRRGLCAALGEAGFTPHDAHGLEDLAAPAGRSAVLATLVLPDDTPRLARWRATNPGLVIVAMLQQPVVTSYQQALEAGADAAVAWDATPETVVKVLQAALDDHVLLPVAVARALAAPREIRPELPTVSAWEARWLRMMASGMTVAELAREASYSEREMFRLLNRLYQRMGVRHRSEALVKAAQAGLLD